MSEQLTALVLNRSSTEPTKHALLTAICLGSRPLVEFILSLFYEFPGEENCGLLFCEAIVFDMSIVIQI
uniref:Uncharacterized protein n=1 Tax=Parascaris equorum TaxID=6256 RepID=A0A914RI79_PAREQ